MLEFALVAPILLITVTGMFAIGMSLNNELALTSATNTGAQLLAISRGQTTDPCATAFSAIANAAPTLAAGSITTNFTINGTTYAATNTCPGAAANMIQAASATITATYPCSIVYYGVSVASCKLQAQVTELIQ